jgi:tetratricopeptide (TPR) repeat protein
MDSWKPSQTCDDSRGRPRKDNAPPERRKFAGDWDEIGHLYDKLLYWLYEREDPAKARPYARRLERLLRRADRDHGAIFGEECWSLIYEAKGDLRKAIKHRENEIRLIHRLYKVCMGTPAEEIALRDYRYDDLSDRMDLLAMLYYDSGDLRKAISILKKSKKLCEAHGVAFDGEDLLQDYLKEKRHSRWPEPVTPAARRREPHPPPRSSNAARRRGSRP